MISPDYFDQRWSWYQPILGRGENPANRCHVDVRRLPLRVPGQDAREYIPFALHSQLQQTLSQSLSRLQDHAVRYIVKGEKVSAHQLPQTDAESRAMIHYLREKYPHISRNLLHHWCADEKGAPALLKMWQDMWLRGWQQEKADMAPWVPAVNVLLLRLMRESLARLPKEQMEQISHALLCILGGLYHWALMAFLKQHADGTVEVTRIATYESMVLPATPMAFMMHQPDDALLGDDRQIIMAYGLEPDLVPRMRSLRKKLGPKNEAGMLVLLSKDRLGGHLLRRSWARLALWDLAEKTGEGAWMRWVLNAKLLDQLMTSPDQLEPAFVEMLEANRQHPIAAWLLHERGGGGLFRKGGGGEPWLHDDRTLQAFRVFEEDVLVEIARRQAERLWLDQMPAIAGKARGNEADKLLEAAYKDGKIVFLLPGTEASLHSGVRLSSKQGCLMIDWSDYLAAITSLQGDAAGFFSKDFLPGVLRRTDASGKVFTDSLSAAGCTLRGPVMPLVEIGLVLRQQMREWYLEAGGSQAEGEDGMPTVSMCLALVGEWTYAESAQAGPAARRLAFSLAVPQASAGLGRDGGTGRLAAYRDAKTGRKPHGSVRVESVDTGTGQRVQLLYNGGFALTASAVSELTSAVRERASVREHRMDREVAQSVLREFRLPEGQFDLFSIQQGAEGMPVLLLLVGRPCLSGVDVDLYELLDPNSPAALRIFEEGLPRWR
ncbi:MAG TPA: hypothetical protein VNH42_02325 [Mariprofundaceae bacterium]|nr:hypothetical protein [Mariprofundaceae bacterium]